jgi:hypothetical protein
VDELKFQQGDLVDKVGGDYSFSGVVVAAFRKLSGKDRYVVEDDRGVLHVFGPSNLERRVDSFEKRTGVRFKSARVPSDAAGQDRGHETVASILDAMSRRYAAEESNGLEEDADETAEAKRILRMLGIDPSNAIVMRLRP